MKAKLLSLFVCIILLSCVEEEQSVFDIEIDSLFATFEEEAFIRNVEIDIDDFDLTTSLELFEDTQAIGLCRSYSNGDHEILLDERYWNQATYNEKEFLLFHELGHCVLDKEHDNTQDNNGNCISIMQSGTGGCSLNYNNSTKNDYLDELFEI